MVERIVGNDVYDVVIVGAGPNGVYAAYRVRQELPWARLLVLESGEVCGSLARYPDVRWHSKMKELRLPSALNSIISDEYTPTSSELVSYYANFAKEHAIPVRTQSQVTNITEKTGDLGHPLLSLEFENEKGKDHELLARYVILATGIFGNPRSLEVQGKNMLAQNYSLGLQNLNLFLVGAGNSAADFIMYLLPHNRITWVIRDATWKSVFANLLPKFESVLEEFSHNLTLITNTEVVAVNETGQVELSDGRVLGPYDEHFALLGFTSISPLVVSIGLKTEFECLSLSSCFETSLKSVFAFGSLAATWDQAASRASPTYIHNGNESQLAIILGELKIRWAKQMFPMSQTEAILNVSKSAKGIRAALTRKGRRG